MAATGNGYLTRQSYRFLPTDRTAPLPSEPAFELDESDIYNSGSTRSNSPELRNKSVPSSRKKAPSKRSDGVGAPSSLPVNIPDWSKILKNEYRENRRRDSDGEDDRDDDDDAVRMPPHEFLARQMARTRIASFSVHEGIGRTLKGRDLSRVRNAIWEKTGFQD